VRAHIASLFHQFTDTDVYKTGSDKIRKTHHKISVDILIFLQCSGTQLKHRSPRQAVDRTHFRANNAVHLARPACRLRLPLLFVLFIVYFLFYRPSSRKVISESIGPIFSNFQTGRRMEPFIHSLIAQGTLPWQRILGPNL